jgi:hypothetical protein
MMSELFFIFYIGFALSMAIFLDLRQRAKQIYGVLLLAVGVVLAVFVAREIQGVNLMRAIFLNMFSEGRVGLVNRTIALSMGVFAGVSLPAHVKSPSWRAIQVLSLTVAVLSASTLLLRGYLSGFLSSPEASVSSGFLSIGTSPGVKVKRIDLPFYPTSLVKGSDTDKVFIAGYTGFYLQGGSVYYCDFTTRDIGPKQVASGFTRPHGLAFKDGELFVSRAGQFSRAINGKMIQEATGAVTLLRDIDRDGVFDYYKDVVSGLPGAQLPDGLHQNNGLEIVGDSLFITVGVSTDHTPAVLETEGTILKCNLDGSDLKVFAKGLRNPFGISYGPLGKIYVTDNDPNFAELGDKLCLVEEGSTFQFPYDTLDGVVIDGGVPPLARYSSAQGLSYVPKGEPNNWSDSLLIAAYGDNAISSVRISRSDSGFMITKPEFVAKINQVVDVEYVGNNILYALSYADKALYRIELDSTYSASSEK